MFFLEKFSVRLKKWGSGHTLDHTDIDDSSNTCIILKRKKTSKLKQIKKKNSEKENAGKGKNKAREKIKRESE